MKPSITRPVTRLLGTTLFFLLASSSVFPQQSISAKAGNIQFIQGEVFLNGKSLKLRNGNNIQMENNQFLTTGKGYAELLLAPYAYLRLGGNASLRIRQTKLTEIQIELNRGAAIMEITKKIKTDPIRLYISGGVIRIKKDGLYRFDAGSGTLRVYGGDARVIKGEKEVRIKSGRMADLDSELRSEKFDVHTIDALHWWSAQRSLALYARNLFFARQLYPLQLDWRTRQNGLYNRNYRVTIAANKDWNRYWLGVMSVLEKRAREIMRTRWSDPDSLLTPEQRRLVP